MEIGLRFPPGQVGMAQFWGPLLLLGSPQLPRKPHSLCRLGWGVWHGSRTSRVFRQQEALRAPLPPAVSMVLLMGKEICVFLESGGLRQRKRVGEEPDTDSESRQLKERLKPEIQVQKAC